MIVDFVNRQLIEEFYNFKEDERIELSILRDRIFPNLTKTKKQEKLCFIRDRLQAMPECLFEIKKNGENKWTYNLVTENVFFGDIRVFGEQKKVMALKINNKWQIYEL